MKEKIASVAIAGFAFGRIIFVNIFHSDAPSIRAEQIISSGIVIKYCLIRNIPVGVAAGGMIIAHNESYIPKNVMILKIGAIKISRGNMMVDKIIIMITVDPLNLYFARAYPLMVLITTAMIVEVVATINEFKMFLI